MQYVRYFGARVGQHWFCFGPLDHNKIISNMFLVLHNQREQTIA